MFHVAICTDIVHTHINTARHRDIVCKWKCNKQLRYIERETERYNKRDREIKKNKRKHEPPNGTTHVQIVCLKSWKLLPGFTATLYEKMQNETKHTKYTLNFMNEISIAKAMLLLQCNHLCNPQNQMEKMV